MTSLIDGLNSFYAAQGSTESSDSVGLMIETNDHRKARTRRVIALKVHPSQREEAMADAAAKGVPTPFDLAGYPEFGSRRHQRDYNRAYGYVNRDGGYSDV